MTQSKARRITAWTLSVLITLVFVGSAIAKLTRAPSVVEVVTAWGLSDHLLLIAILELASALLFLIPLTNSLGVLLLSAYLGGAIVTHMQHGESYVAPAVLLAVVWVAGYLRHPELLESFRTAKA